MTTAIEIARHACRARRACVAASVTLVTILVVAGMLLPVAPVDAATRPLQSASHTVWLCRPGASSDPCASALTATTWE
jgi:hypothetical protein